jgi:hypothetical protein
MCLISAEILIKAVHGDVSTAPLPEPLRRNTSAASEPPLTAVP